MATIATTITNGTIATSVGENTTQIAADREAAETARTAAETAQADAEAAASQSQLAVISAIETLPGSPVGLWLPFDADPGAGGILPYRSTASFPNNLLHYPNGYSESVQGISLLTTSNLTLTRDYSDGPNTDDRAMQAVSTTTAGYVRSNNVPFDAGTYTMSMEVRAASAVNFLFGPSTGTDVIAATTSWQTVTKTFVHAGGNLIANWALADGVSNFDLEISQIRIHAGSSDLGVDPISYPLWFGRSRDDSVNPASFDPPSWNSRGLIALGKKETISAATIIAAVFSPASETTLRPILQTAAPSDKLSLNINTTNIHGFLDAKVDVLAPEFVGVDGDGWTIVALQADANGSALFRDGSPVLVDDSKTLTPFEAAYWGFRNDNWNDAGARIGAIGLWHESLSARDIALASSIMRQHTSASGLTTAPRPVFLYAGGDSITFGFANGGVSYATLAYTDDTTITGNLLAVSGDTLDDQKAVAQGYFTAWRAAVGQGSQPIYSLLIGRNDDVELDTDPLVYYERVIDELVRPIRELGVTVILCDILPGDNEGAVSDYNAARGIFNARAAAREGIDFDVYCDFSSVAAGQDGAEANATLYPDQVHPSGTAHLQLQPLYEAAVAKARGI